MLIIIKDKTTLIKQVVNTYFEYKGITIYKDGDYFISLKNGFHFIDNSQKQKLRIDRYVLYHNEESRQIYLYVYDNTQNINNYLLYENSDFYMSNKENSTIINKDKYLKDYYLELSGGYLDTNYSGLIVNNKKYNGNKLINNDHVEMLGFDFFYYSDFLYMNGFEVDIKIKRKEIKEEIYEYKNTLPLINNFYEATKKGLKLEKLETFNPPKKGNNRKVILQIGPTITMSLAMIMMASINVYNTYLNNGSKLNIISLLIMPITMLISGILWPTITSAIENGAFNKEYTKTKKEYLKYLKEYDEELNQKIINYIKEEKYALFDVTQIENKLFYINNKSKDFLKLYLGFITTNIDFEYKITKDNEIDEYLKRIKYRTLNIDNCPLYLNLKECRYTTIIVKENELDYYLNRYFLELIYKHHFDELTIGIYAKDMNTFKDIFAIPHLFYQNKRLTLTNERQLQDLNNYKANKPLVLLLKDYTDFSFTNPNIYVIYFSTNKTKLMKNSNCVVEFSKKGNYRYKEQIEFNYYKEEIKFKKYYDYISLFRNSNLNDKIFSFKDIYPNINIINNYLINKTGLKAYFATINDETLMFDLHESKDGPHGLIGGSTGSGKSELIISLLLSLAIRYSPEYLNIILIDYKGGGIKESLTYEKKCIPHIVAAINNLEADTFERLIVAINRECKKRQELFKNLSIKVGTSIMNIDDYLEQNKEYGFPNIAHMLIVIDEFAELKKENPLIIRELISFSRIGRSLGIHLILATQRPSGVIDEEIWSNSHFKIALKVHSEKDSNDIIKTKDAAYLTSPGEFYLQVDDNTLKTKAIYSKKDINNNEQLEVSLLNNELEVISKKTYKKDNLFYESTHLTKQILEVCDKLKYNTNSFEFEKPFPLSRYELMNKYQSINKYVFGEIDDYLNAKKGMLDFSLDENLLIYSNRNIEINSIINTLSENKRKMIIISNNRYQSSYILDSLLYEDEEDIRYLFNKLANDKESNIHLIIEDLNILFSYDENYLNSIYELTRRSSISNFSLVILTKQSNINFKLLNSFKNKLAIAIYDSQDLINLFSTKGNYHGKSYFFNEQPITFIPIIEENVIEDKVSSYPYIDRIPEKIDYEYIRDSLLIGYDYMSRQKITIKDNETLLITSYDIEILNTLRIIYIRNPNVIVKKYEDNLIKEKYNNILWLSDGLYSQRLFYVDKDYNLKPNEAYLYRNNKGRIIKTINL